MSKTASVKVVALQAGFYGGGRVREGQEFYVEPGVKAKWFAPVDGEVAKAAKPAKADKNEPTTLAAADKAGTFNDAVKGGDKKSDLA